MRPLHVARSIFAASLIALTAAGCASDGGDLGDATDPQLDDEKADGFTSPTRHGWLTFAGWMGPTSVRDWGKFHAWRFDLAGEALVQLSTESSSVGTALYLYRKNPRTGRWGYPIAKDYDGAFLVEELGAGEYQIIAKAKTSTGDLILESSCDGEGCPLDETECRFDAIEPLPAEVAPTAACARDLVWFLTGPTDLHRTQEVRLATRGRLTPREQRALEMVTQSMCATDLFQPFPMSSATNTNDETTLVHFVTDADVGTDSFVMLQRDRLPVVQVDWLHDSGEVRWTCADDDSAKITAPPAHCLVDAFLVSSGKVDEDGFITGSGEGESLGEELPVLVRAAMNAHPRSILGFSYEAWVTPEGEGARVTIESPNGSSPVTTVYYVGERGDRATTFATMQGASAALPCTELDLEGSRQH